MEHPMMNERIFLFFGEMDMFNIWSLYRQMSQDAHHLAVWANECPLRFV